MLITKRSIAAGIKRNVSDLKRLEKCTQKTKTYIMATNNFSSQPPFGAKITNRTDDIDGARPTPAKQNRKNPIRKYTTLTTDDIEGAKPKTQNYKYNKPDSYGISDIEGAKPRKYGFRTTRCIDPLDPNYNLPKTKPIVYPTPKFIRDQIDVSDIEGTRPKAKRVWKERNSYDVSDIEGTNAKWKPHNLRTIGTRPGARKPDFTYDISDIVGNKFKSSRFIDPLQPVYNINGDVVHDFSTQTVASRQNKVLSSKREKKNAGFYSLITKDITGAQSDTGSSSRRLRVHERKQFRNTNHVADIRGAKPNPKRYGIAFTKRRTNPLNPRYTYLNGTHTPTPSDTDFLPNKMKLDIANLKKEAFRTSTERSNGNNSSQFPHTSRTVPADNDEYRSTKIASNNRSRPSSNYARRPTPPRFSSANNEARKGTPSGVPLMRPSDIRAEIDSVRNLPDF